MGKIEKTLELNITHELISLADSFWYYLSNISLRRYWRPSWRLPLLKYPKSYVTGLPLNLEGKAGGGYDVSLHSPGIMNHSERIVFIQFKAGEHSDYCDDQKSVFYGSESKPNRHVLFAFNNNTNKNQHLLLQDLSREMHPNGHPVLYAFPSVINESDVKKFAGRLLHKTSFISIKELDEKAKNNGIIIKAGKEHNFRTCYRDYSKNEVNFFLFVFDGEDYSKDFISEIITIRVMRALIELKKSNINLPIYMTNVAEAFIQFIRYLAEYFGLNFFNERENFINLIEAENITYSISRMNAEDSVILKEDSELDIPRNREIFLTILRKLNPFFSLTEATFFSEIDNIPNAPNYFTFEIPLDRAFVTKDFENIGYTIY